MLECNVKFNYSLYNFIWVTLYIQNKSNTSHRFPASVLSLSSLKHLWFRFRAKVFLCGRTHIRHLKSSIDPFNFALEKLPSSSQPLMIKKSELNLIHFGRTYICTDVIINSPQGKLSETCQDLQPCHCLNTNGAQRLYYSSIHFLHQFNLIFNL